MDLIFSKMRKAKRQDCTLKESSVQRHQRELGARKFGAGEVQEKKYFKKEMLVNTGQLKPSQKAFHWI